MRNKIRILFLSANPWTTSRILVDKEAREIFEKLEEGPYRHRFELLKHTAIRPGDLQRLLMKHRPHIVHFSGHGSRKRKIILEGGPGRGKQVDSQGLVEVLSLYKDHVRLVLFNACFTEPQAISLTKVIDYSVGISKAIGDRAGVTFAGAFYRALSFGRSLTEAFASAKAELRLTKTPRSQGIELFVRQGLKTEERFPCTDSYTIDDEDETLKALSKLIATDSMKPFDRDTALRLLKTGFIVKEKHERMEGEARIVERSVVSYFRVSPKQSGTVTAQLESTGLARSSMKDES